MFFYEGQSCPVCGQYFAESDDIVTCPECGAPHHRECWRKEGHCHFADAHGTERQWAKADATVPPAKKQEVPTRCCPNCGSKNPEFAEFCAHCGRELDAEPQWTSAPPPPVNQYTPPSRSGFGTFNNSFQDPFGGIPRTEEIEGVSVETIAEVIGANSGYYLPRFYNMSRNGKKTSWNWAAFLLSYNWLLYRKNLLWGLLAFGFGTILEFFNSYAVLKLQTALNAATTVIPPNAASLMGIILISSGAILVMSLLFGLFGNYLYMQHVLRKARKLQEDPDAKYNSGFFQTGGTSFALGIAPNLLLIFIQNLITILML